MHSFDIRRMEERDIPIVLEYQKKLDSFHAKLRPDLYTEEGCNLTEDNLKSKSGINYVATDGEKVIGYVMAVITTYQAVTSIKEKFMHVSWLFVEENYRGSGVGTALMQRILDDAKNLGYRRVTFNVVSGNPAIKLYEELGAKPMSLHMEISV